jgi:hypothetical protein
MQRLPQQKPGHGKNAQGYPGKGDRLFRLPQGGRKAYGESPAKRPEFPDGSKGYGIPLSGLPWQGSKKITVLDAPAENRHTRESGYP